MEENEAERKTGYNWTSVDARWDGREKAQQQMQMITTTNANDTAGQRV